MIITFLKWKRETSNSSKSYNLSKIVNFSSKIFNNIIRVTVTPSKSPSDITMVTNSVLSSDSALEDYHWKRNGIMDEIEFRILVQKSIKDQTTGICRFKGTTKSIKD